MSLENKFSIKKQPTPLPAESPKSELQLEVEIEHQVENREFFDNLLDKVILDNYQKINSGQHGIVGSFDLKQVKGSFVDRTKELLGTKEAELPGLLNNLEAVFRERFGELPAGKDKRAIKILKIFSETKGNHEVAMQKKSYNVIEQAKIDNPDKQFAGIPKIYFNRVIDLIKEPDILKKLKIDNVEIQRQAYVVAMDYYEGDDFAEHIYRSALADVGGVRQEEIKSFSFDELKARVAQLKIPGTLSDRSPANKLTPLQTYRHNNKALLDRYSKEHGVIDETIFTKLKNTVEALNSQGIYHRDLHERNVFLSKQDGQIQDAHVLDFDTAKEAEAGESFASIYRDSSREYIKDGYLVASYKEIGR